MWKIGLQKYAIDQYTAGRFLDNLKAVCAEIHGKGGENEFKLRVSKYPGIKNYGTDGALEDSGADWSPLVRRLGAELENAPESLSIIWP